MVNDLNPSQRSARYKAYLVYDLAGYGCATMSGTTYENDGESIAIGRRKLTALHAQFNEHSLTTPIQFVGFWSAVVCPFCYLILLLNGLSGAEMTAFLGLLGCNVVSLLIGHAYGQE